MQEIKEKFGDARKTEITYLEDEVRIKDLIKEEDVVITISHLGYIKRTSADEYRPQRRGGRGVNRWKNKGRRLYRASFCSFYTSYHVVLYRKGKMLLVECIRDPGRREDQQGQGYSKSDSIAWDDKVRAIIDVKDLKDEEFVKSHNIVLCTKKGIIKKTELEDFSRPR